MEKILCRECKQSKELDEFYRRKSDGKLTNKICKTCRREQAKNAYYEKGGFDALKQWREENPELYRLQHQTNNRKRKERMAIDPEFANYVREQKRLNHKKNFISGMVSRARQRATKLGLQFEVTVENIVIPELCPILEVPLVLGTKGDYQFSPSIDRLDSSKGYTLDNIRVISSLANTMKNCATKDQLLTFSRNIPVYIQSVI